MIDQTIVRPAELVIGPLVKVAYSIVRYVIEWTIDQTWFYVLLETTFQVVNSGKHSTRNHFE